MAIYIHSSINSTKISLPNIYDNHEIIGIQINSEEPFQLFSFYNPPCCKLSNDLFNYLNLNYKNFLLIGDLNASHQSWHCKNNNNIGNELANIINTNDLFVNNNRSTYIPNFNIIDLSMCTSGLLSRIENFEVGKNMGSDHFPTITTVNATNAGKTQERYYQNWKLFKDNLQNNHHEIDLKDITKANLDDMVKMTIPNYCSL